MRHTWYTLRHAYYGGRIRNVTSDSQAPPSHQAGRRGGSDLKALGARVFNCCEPKLAAAPKLNFKN